MNWTYKTGALIVVLDKHAQKLQAEYDLAATTAQRYNGHSSYAKAHAAFILDLLAQNSQLVKRNEEIRSNCSDLERKIEAIDERLRARVDFILTGEDS